MMQNFEKLGGASFGTLGLKIVEMNGLDLNPNAILAGDAHGPLDTGTGMVIDLHR